MGHGEQVELCCSHRGKAHYFVPGAERSICGVLRGDAVPIAGAVGRLCLRCREWKRRKRVIP